jgi:hypothetical protein
MAVSGEKLDGGPTDHTAGLGVLLGARFWEQQGPSNADDGMQNVVTYVDCLQEAYASCISGFPRQGVYRFKSP